MSHLLSEKRLTLSALARREGVNLSSIWRWTLRGVRGCRLETYSVGAKKVTTEESFIRFTEACTLAASGTSPTVAPPQTNRARAAAIAAAERELSHMGV